MTEEIDMANNDLLAGDDISIVDEDDMLADSPFPNQNLVNQQRSSTIIQGAENTLMEVTQENVTSKTHQSPLLRREIVLSKDLNQSPVKSSGNVVVPSKDGVPVYSFEHIELEKKLKAQFDNNARRYRHQLRQAKEIMVDVQRVAAAPFTLETAREFAVLLPKVIHKLENFDCGVAEEDVTLGVDLAQQFERYLARFEASVQASVASSNAGSSRPATPEEIKKKREFFKNEVSDSYDKLLNVHKLYVRELEKFAELRSDVEWDLHTSFEDFARENLAHELDAEIFNNQVEYLRKTLGFEFGTSSVKDVVEFARPDPPAQKRKSKELVFSPNRVVQIQKKISNDLPPRNLFKEISSNSIKINSQKVNNFERDNSNNDMLNEKNSLVVDSEVNLNELSSRKDRQNYNNSKHDFNSNLDKQVVINKSLPNSQSEFRDDTNPTVTSNQLVRQPSPTDMEVDHQEFVEIPPIGSQGANLSGNRVSIDSLPSSTRSASSNAMKEGNSISTNVSPHSEYKALPLCWMLEPKQDSASAAIKPPKFFMPKWNGELLTYPDFIHAFAQFVHMRVDLAIPQKILLLNQAIPQQLVNDFTTYRTDETGYHARLQHLHEQYGNEQTLRSVLWREIFHFPSSDGSDVKQIRRNLQKLSTYVETYRKMSPLFDEEHFYNLCVNKFPKRAYQFTYQGSIRSVKSLFQAVKEFIRQQELSDTTGYLSALPKNDNSSNQNSKKSNTFQSVNKAKPVHTFFNTKSESQNKGQGKKNFKKQKDESVVSKNFGHNQKTNNSGNPNVTAGKAASVQNLPRTILAALRRTKKYVHDPCKFCGGRHHTFLCTDPKTNTLQGRKEFCRKNNLCEKCIKVHFSGQCNQQQVVTCKWFDCLERGHNSVLCPKLPTVTPAVRDAWFQKITPIWNSSPFQSEYNFDKQLTSSEEENTSKLSITLSNTNLSSQIKPVSNTCIEDKAATSKTVMEVITNAGPALSESTIILSTYVIRSKIESCLLTFRAFVKISHDSSLIPICGFLDTGSPRSYIRADTSEKLGLTSEKQEILQLKAVEHAETAPFHSNRVSLLLEKPTKEALPVTLSTIDQIGCNLPIVNEVLFKRRYPQYKHITFTKVPKKHNIDILLGNDFMWSFIEEIIKLDHPTCLIRTSFGYTLGGVQFAEYEDKNFLPNYLISPQSIENLWKLEVLGIEPHKFSEAQDELQALELFFKRIELINNRYQIRWLYKFDPPPICDNFNLSFKRLENQLHKLNTDKEFFERYDGYFKNLLDLGMIEQVDLVSTRNYLHYLPHKGILDLTKNTPLRVVFDGSAKSKGASHSINECMYKGTNFLSNILQIFFNFQQRKIALITDIKKAFHQIGLHPDDRDVCRFLWIKSPANRLTRDNLVVYRFARVPFGIITSPFILAATLLYHFQKSDTEFHRQFANNFYVDNLITSVETEEEAIKLHDKVIRIFNEVSMELGQWGSNSETVRAHFNPDNALQDPITKVLGIMWDMVKDMLYLKPKKLKVTTFTKRTFLQVLSSVYDPLGWFSPAFLPSRVFLKKLWQSQLKWDEQLPEELQIVAHSLIEELFKTFQYVFPRQLFSVPFNPEFCQIHVFVDASQTAYSFVLYLRLQAPYSSEVMVKLRFSKSRISPMKEMTIPRLELMAALIGSRAVTTVRTAMNLQNCDTYLWSDSKCVLVWLLERKVLTQFVSNRVKEIKEVPNVTFRYVPSVDNPADIGSRGTPVDTLVSSIWWAGPAWLSTSTEYWPETDLHIVPDDTSDTVERVFIGTTLKSSLSTCPRIYSLFDKSNNEFWSFNLTKRKLRINNSKKKLIPHFTLVPQSQNFELRMSQSQNEDKNSSQELTHKSKAFEYNLGSLSKFPMNTPLGIIIEQYNSIDRIITKFLMALKFIRNLTGVKSHMKFEISKSKKCWATLPLTFNNALLAFIFADQRKHFPELVNILTKDNAPSYVIYHKFHIVIDDEGILRLKNYIPYSPFGEDVLSPILLNTKSHLCKLIVMHLHKINCHAGTKFTVAAFRRHYFTPQGHRAIAKILRTSCPRCEKNRAVPFAQPTHATMPDFRLLPYTHPFTFTGVDIFGPFQVFDSYLPRSKTDNITRTTTPYKCWGIIFTCLSTRAVHIMPLQSLEITAIWTTFTSFLADRGTPRLIVSDNAAQFKLIALYLPKFWETFRTYPEVAAGLRQNNIQWYFTPAKAPWYGGVYERLIGLVKQAYYNTLGHQTVLKRLFDSTLKNIQSMLNERPLCPASDDAEQIALTPAHFLHANLGSYLIDPNVPLDDATPTANRMVKFWKRDEEYISKLWLQWKHLYLTYLRDKPPKAIPNSYRVSPYIPKVGELVHVLDYKSKPGVYKLAKIIKLPISRDGNIRHAEIEFASGIKSSRPLKFLAPLELTRADSPLPPKV